MTSRRVRLRRIAEVHGGTITVESGDNERGCRVIMTLPSRPLA
jgi:signal transduction histidine kinase